jgi:hypothetical protein
MRRGGAAGNTFLLSVFNAFANTMVASPLSRIRDAGFGVRHARTGRTRRGAGQPRGQPPALLVIIIIRVRAILQSDQAIVQLLD